MLLALIPRFIRRTDYQAAPLAPSTKWRIPSGVAIAMIVVGVILAQAGLSQETKSSGEIKKPDAKKRGAIGILLYESEDHVLVSNVVPKSPAEKAGLQVGDDIRYVNHERTKTAKGLMDEISAFHPGTAMEVVIRRKDERKTLKIDVISYAELYPDAPVAKPVTSAAAAPAAMSPETARRMRVLEQQIMRLQQEMEALKATPYVVPQAPPAQSFNIDSWLDQHRRGENGGDPSLFQ